MGIYDRDYYRRETAESPWLTGRTPVTYGLVLANVAVFIAVMLSGRDWRVGSVENALALVPQKAIFEFQMWRLVTAIFCHASVWHILGNMLFLWWFGRELEKLYGSREFLLYYLVAGVVSSLAWSVITVWAEADPAVRMVGASGAVTAVTVLYTLYNPRHTILIYGLIPIEMRWMVLIYLGVDFWGLFGPNYSAVAHVAHLGGAAYAVIYKYADFRAGRLFARRPVRLSCGELQRGPVQADEPPESSSLDEALEHRMDTVLAKIARAGPQSLTDQERQILDEASRQLRDRRG